MMKKYIDSLKSVGLFTGMDAADLESVLTCLGAEVKGVHKDEIVLLAGEKPRDIGIVLSGQFHILKEDYEGNRALVAAVTPGEIFAEALCCADVAESPVTVIADTESTVMLLGFPRILRTCRSACLFHTTLIKNMLGLLANKNLQLQKRMEVVGLKSIRMKITRYLESFVPSQGRNITVPFNREELADFLCVERSALSHELARMKKDGLIEYKKNNFLLL